MVIKRETTPASLRDNQPAKFLQIIRFGKRSTYSIGNRTQADSGTKKDVRNRERKLFFNLPHGDLAQDDRYLCFLEQHHLQNFQMKGGFKSSHNPIKGTWGSLAEACSCYIV